MVKTAKDHLTALVEGNPSVLVVFDGRSLGFDRCRNYARQVSAAVLFYGDGDADYQQGQSKGTWVITAK